MKITKKQLREIVRKELHTLQESRAEEKLSKMIRDLRIKDKALESVIRELAFSNTPRYIESVLRKHMPDLN